MRGRGRGVGRERQPLPPGFGTIWTTVALDLVGFGIVLPILPLYAEDFGASGTVVGLLVASFSIAQLLFAPVWGRVSDRVGRKPVLIVSLVGTAVGSFLTGIAGSLWVLFAGRIIDGISGGSVSVAQAAVTDLAPPAERPRLLGLLGAAFGVGFVAGPAIGGLAALGGPHVPFFIAAALAAVNAVVAAKRLPETSTAAIRRTARPAAGAPSGPETSAVRSALVRYALVAFVSLMAFSGFEATFSLFGERRFGLTISSAAAVFAGIGLVLVIVQGGLIGPAVARFGTAGSLRLGLSSGAGGMAALAVATTWPVLALALLLIVVGQGMVTPTLSALVANRAPAPRRGGALGMQQAAGGLGRVVGPALGGVLFEHVGLAAPYVVGAVLTLAALGLVAGERDQPDGGVAHTGGAGRQAAH
ncbi:MAG: MFS transporter [Acidimicrobiales bacterium]|nr:MFS transporter [Acidimicrobiales bacterium]